MLTTVLVFLLVLSILVLVHELGHFLVAKHFGILVEEFGFGLPPRVWGKKIGETLYSINALPFGGFVKLHGEDDPGSITVPGRAFLNKGKLPRVLVITAGVVMNFILAFICFSIVYSFSGIPRQGNKIKILDISASSPAQTAGILSGDYVTKVDGVEVNSSEDFIKQIEDKKGQKVDLTVLRQKDTGQETVDVKLTPRENPPENEGPLGVVVTSTEIYFPPIWQRPFYGAYYGFKDAIFWGQTVVLGFAKIFTDLFGGVVPKDVAGPVGIFAITSQAAALGVLAVVNFIGILSVNLAILNIIPFPALDGGRLLFVAIETFFGRKVMPKVESTIHAVGMVILILLILLITANDIKRLVASGSLSGFVQSVLSK